MNTIEHFKEINNQQLEKINGGIVGTVVGVAGLAIASAQFSYWLGQTVAETNYNRTHR